MMEFVCEFYEVSLYEVRTTSNDWLSKRDWEGVLFYFKSEDSTTGEIKISRYLESVN